MRTGRPASRPGGRPNVVSIRLSDAEAAHVDAARGHLTRGEWFRMLLVRDKRALEAEKTPE